MQGRPTGISKIVSALWEGPRPTPSPACWLRAMTLPASASSTHRAMRRARSSSFATPTAWRSAATSVNTMNLLTTRPRIQEPPARLLPGPDAEPREHQAPGEPGAVADLRGPRPAEPGRRGPEEVGGRGTEGLGAGPWPPEGVGARRCGLPRELAGGEGWFGQRRGGVGGWRPPSRRSRSHPGRFVRDWCPVGTPDSGRNASSGKRPRPPPLSNPWGSARPPTRPRWRRPPFVERPLMESDADEVGSRQIKEDEAMLP